jgi:hypothetical protein
MLCAAIGLTGRTSIFPERFSYGMDVNNTTTEVVTSENGIEDTVTAEPILKPEQTDIDGTTSNIESLLRNEFATQPKEVRASPVNETDIAPYEDSSAHSNSSMELDADWIDRMVGRQDRRAATPAPGSSK